MPERCPIPAAMLDSLPFPCAECGKMPVKSRRNSVCLTCSAVVCIACQMSHFVENHER